jgi:hypothetical protein
MNPWRWVDSRVRQVKVADLEAYLLGHGWVLHPNPNHDLLRFERPAEDNGDAVFQMVPAKDDPREYPQRIVELITTLSELEDRHPVKVLDDILHASADALNGNARRSTVGQTKQ